MVDPRPEEPPPVDVNRIHEFIGDVEWPADRDELTRHAEARNAPDEVLRMFRKLRAGSYEGEAGVYQDLLKGNKTPYR